MASTISDDWHPTATVETLRLRAELMSRLRVYFAAHGCLEVETPALSGGAATDVQLCSMRTRVSALGGEMLYLQTSPEYSMKRLLAAGFGDIFQICKVFRDGEIGRFHNPEFTMLEWYRVGVDHHVLMHEVATVIELLLGSRARANSYTKRSYRDAVLEATDIDPFAASIEDLLACLEAHTVDVPEPLERDRTGLLDLLYATLVVPSLGHDGLAFVYDFPVEHAALARIRDGSPPVAERFEACIDGLELANGFHELTDADEQLERMRSDLDVRATLGRDQPPIDQRLLAALKAGLPQCAGVALGLDRAVMLAAGADDIREVMAFTTNRA